MDGDGIDWGGAVFVIVLWLCTFIGLTEDVD